MKTEGNDNWGRPNRNDLVCVAFIGSCPIWIKVLAKSNGCVALVTPVQKFKIWYFKIKLLSNILFLKFFYDILYQFWMRHGANVVWMYPNLSILTTNRRDKDLKCCNLTLLYLYKETLLILESYEFLKKKFRFSLFVYLKSWRRRTTFQVNPDVLVLIIHHFKKVSIKIYKNIIMTLIFRHLRLIL